MIGSDNDVSTPFGSAAERIRGPASTAAAAAPVLRKSRRDGDMAFLGEDIGRSLPQNTPAHGNALRTNYHHAIGDPRDYHNAIGDPTELPQRHRRSAGLPPRDQ